MKLVPQDAGIIFLGTAGIGLDFGQIAPQVRTFDVSYDLPGVLGFVAADPPVDPPQVVGFGAEDPCDPSPQVVGFFAEAAPDLFPEVAGFEVVGEPPE